MTNNDLARIDAEIAEARRLLLAGEQDERGLLLYLTDWMGERKLVEREMERDRLDETNLQTAAQFIRANFADTDRIAVMLIGQERVVTRIGPAQSFAGDGYLRWLQQQNREHGANVHIGINPLKPYANARTKENVREIARVYLDFDLHGKAAIDKLMESPLPKPEYIINTSPDRYQAVWRTQGFTQTQAETLQKRLAVELGADRAATDIARLMRVPGFANTKYPDSPIVQAERLPDAVPVTPAHFPERLLAPERTMTREIERTPYSAPNERVAPEALIARALQRAGESRNAGGFWLATQARDNGYSQTEAQSLMREYVNRAPDIEGKEPYTEREAMKSLESAYRHPAREPWLPKEPQRGQWMSR